MMRFIESMLLDILDCCASTFAN